MYFVWGRVNQKKKNHTENKNKTNKNKITAKKETTNTHAMGNNVHLFLLNPVQWFECTCARAYAAAVVVGCVRQLTPATYCHHYYRL